MNNNAKKKTENKIVNNGFVFGGVIGFLIGGFLCIISGVPEGMFWLAFIPALIGGIIGTNIAAKTASQKAEKKIAAQKQRQENFVAEYKTVVQHLPKEQMLRLYNTISLITSNLIIAGFETRDFPVELSKMAFVVKTFTEENQYGTLTTEQSERINKALDDFEESIRYVIPAMQKGLDQAANQGLGFGVIGSSVDVALYNVMDTAERMKNIKTEINATRQSVDQKVKQLLAKLRAAVPY